MSIKDATCGGKTCFYLEDDTVPYINVKPTNERKGVYCRGADIKQGGSKIGPGIEQMGNSKQDIYAVTDYLTGTHMPRCLEIELKGSFYAIALATLAPGATKPKAFAYSPSKAMGTETAHCVYDSLKPRCADYSQALTSFKGVRDIGCAASTYEPTCLDMCYDLHCPEDQPCGKTKSFDDCARCCGSNNNQASGCFRRRRRLGQVLSKKKAHDFEEGKQYSQIECAESCLNTMGCMSWRVLGDICQIASNCDKAPAPPGADKIMLRGNWHVYRGLTAKELNSQWEEKPKKSGDDAPKKKKKKKKGKKN